MEKADERYVYVSAKTSKILRQLMENVYPKITCTLILKKFCTKINLSINSIFYQFFKVVLS